MKKETKIIILRNFVVGRLTGVFDDELSLGKGEDGSLGGI
jgi:hypothetical protein